jgi:hypothetical protein
MAELGRAALVVSLGLSVYALVAGIAAARLGRRRLAFSAQNALVAAFASTLIASAVLLSALLRNDFRSPTSRGRRAKRCRLRTRSQRSGVARRAHSCSGCSFSPASARLLYD